MRRVHVIATGGTIASRTDPALGGARPALTADELVAAVPELAKVAEVSVEQFANVPSQALTLDELLAIGRRVEAVLAAGRADGVVITQGTMTMEESSYLWDLILARPEPVIVTGAMRHGSLPSPDGPRNLLDAVIAAAADATRELGVLVGMNGELHAARDVVKFHALGVDAFRSPDLGPVGFVRNGRVDVHRVPRRREPRLPAPPSITARVHLVRVVAGDDGGLIAAAVRDGADGLVLELMGGGAVPPACVPAIARAVERVPVVGVSRSAAGSMYEDVYAFEGGDRQLRRLGVVFGGSLTGPKARIKLLLCLSAAATLGAHAAPGVAAAFENV